MIRDRIKKLFALARDKGASEHEAARALEMAQRLMMKHGINGNDLVDGPPIGWGDSFALETRWQKILHGGIGHLYAVVSVETDGLGLQFVGKTENVEAAEETLKFIIDQVETLYKQSLPRGLDKKVRHEFRKNFKDGCALRIQERIRELVKTQTTDNEKAAELGTTALVVRKHRDQLMDDTREFLKDLSLKERRPMKMKDGYGTQQGREAGSRVNIHKTVNHDPY